MRPAGPSAPDFRAVFDAGPANYLLLSPDFTIIGVNQRYLAATMTVREEIVGRGLFEIFPDNPDDTKADGVRNLRASLMRVLAHKQPDRMAVQKYDIRRPDADGGGFEERYWSPLNTPVLGPDGEVRCIIHWVEDVTEFVRLKRQMQEQQAVLEDELRSRASKIEAEAFLRTEALEANKRLAESERRYRFMTDAVPQLVWTADPDGSADYFNDRWREFTRLTTEQLRGQGWHETVHPEDRRRTVETWLEAVHAGAERYQMEHRVRHQDGTYRWMLTTALPYRNAGGKVLKWFGTTTDIHDRVIAEEKFRQAQKMEAVGRLAAGVAHDFNNLLTVITTFAEMVLADFGPSDPRREDLDEVLKASAAAAGLTRQLLAFSRQQVIEPKLVTVEDVVRNAEKLLKRLIGEDIELVSALSENPATVKIDPGQLEQVILNLAVNARDAMPMGGKLTLETARVELDKQYARHHWPATPGRFAMLAVSDTGIGMDEATQARIFEPFFTTKEQGKGTGLGLATVYGIVKQAGGFIWVYSEPGQGTTFKLYLPEIDAVPTGLESPGTSSRALRGTETVLLAEDAPAVRAAARQVLERYGYTVLEAPGARAALGIAHKRPGAIHLLLTDVVMPEMSGRQLAEEVTASRPEVKVLYMSGYTDDAVVRHGVLEPGIAYLQKPFTPEALARKVREVLGQG